MVVKVIAWNIAHRKDPWRYLLDTDADIALLSEAAEPPADVVGKLDVDPAPWHTDGTGSWRTAVVRLSNRVDMEWFKINSIANATSDELAVSRLGSIAAAVVTPRKGEPFVAASMYAAWEKAHVTAKGKWIYADASVHRTISDLSALIGSKTKHRILAAGDLNILKGYGEHGDSYWASRYATVFARMEALGLTFIGPQAPAGRRADPWPDELPDDSANVPTFHSNQQKPVTATRQLDFAFASKGLAKDVRVRALNEPDQWGPSDHCRIEIEVIS